MEWQHLAYSHEQVARNLGVDKSTVSCNLQLLNNTGTITKKASPRDKAHKKLTIPAQLLFLNLVVQKPGIYLREIQEELHKMLLLNVDTASICRFIGFTHQKLCLVAKQRGEFTRQQFALGVSLYKLEMLAFLGKTVQIIETLCLQHARDPIEATKITRQRGACYCYIPHVF